MRIRMKFSHRVIVACVGVGIVIVLTNLVYLGILPSPFGSHPEELKKFIKNNPLFSNYHSGKADISQCRANYTLPTDVIYTLDLAEKADYETPVNGQYALPHLSLEDAAYRSNLEPLTVIIVPHSHVDPGWLHTMDEYYNMQVRHILDNMVRKLHLYKDMTFIWAEVVFLSKWWDEQTDVIKDQTLQLVASGRLELVLGGWVMPDEASTHYISTIDQLVEGHQWIMDNLHVRPVNSWSIDPFGHSGTMPYLWKKSGMSNMVIQRIHQSTKGALIKEGSLEFYWKQFWDQSGSSDILCHVMPYMLYSLHHTCGPDKYVCAMFDFRHIDGDAVYHLIKPIDEENIVKKTQQLYEQYRLKASLYKYNTILVPLGDDFRYDHKQEWDQQYGNYKKIMDYMNSRKEWKINMKFGTLNDYFNSVKKQQLKSSVEFPTLNGDFFPYSDQNKAYWTGYYTTRPFDKRFSREVESCLRAAETLNAMALTYGNHWHVKYEEFNDQAVKLRDARRNLGLFLHHDAITGTGKGYVVQDYEQKLFEALHNAEFVLEIAAQFLLSKGQLKSDPVLQGVLTKDLPGAAVMQQLITPTKNGVRIVMYNPTAQFRTEFVTFIIKTVDFEIKDSKRKVIPFQINPTFTTGTEVNANAFEVVFLTEIGPLSLETYVLYQINRTPKSFWSKITIYNTNELIVAPELKFKQERPRSRTDIHDLIYIENTHIGAEFKSYNGMLNEIKDLKTGHKTSMVLEFKHYISRGSGAYIFLPNGPASDTLQGVPIVRVIEGPFMTEIQAVYESLYHKSTLYHHPGIQGKQLYIQNAFDMNVLNMRDREVIMRVSTNLKNELGSFFVDENGFQMIGRKRHPTDGKYQNIDRNYYPLSTQAFIQDKHTRVTLHAGQAHGVASLEKGQFEVMIDRQLLYDDERGLGEGVYDNKLTMTKFVLQVEHSNSTLIDEKFAYQSLQSIMVNENLQQPLQKMFTPLDSDILSLSFIPLPHSLPCDTTIVSMKTLYNSKLEYNGTSLIIHRKGYQCGFSDEGLQCSNSRINIRHLFPGVTADQIRETTLTHLVTKNTKVDLQNLVVPSMEIKSYVVHVKDRTNV